MEKVIVMEKYPIRTKSIYKKDVKYKNLDEIALYLKQRIDEHKSAQFIAVFNNYDHTKSLDGEINEDIKDARSVIFCFGRSIKMTKVVALRPRSIAICELEDKFTLEFVEAPNPDASDFMEAWCEELS